MNVTANGDTLFTVMNKVTINLQSFNGFRGFEANWDAVRTPSYSYYTDKGGIVAAEEAFFLTNAPSDLLNAHQMNTIKQYKGHSLSVGDSVTVECEGVTEEYLCDSIGWKKK